VVNHIMVNRLAQEVGAPQPGESCQVTKAGIQVMACVSWWCRILVCGDRQT